MILGQAAETQSLFNAFLEQSLLLALMFLIIIVLVFYIRSLMKEKRELQDSKDELVKESLGLITLVESQLNENKTSNEVLLKNSSEVLTEIRLIKQLIETN